MRFIFNNYSLLVQGDNFIPASIPNFLIHKQSAYFNIYSLIILLLVSILVLFLIASRKRILAYTRIYLAWKFGRSLSDKSRIIRISHIYASYFSLDKLDSATRNSLNKIKFSKESQNSELESALLLKQILTSVLKQD